MDQNILNILDRLIPRGGTTPSGIYVDFEVYLSRMSNFYRKLDGMNYRLECWNKVCKEHLKKVDEMIKRDPIGINDLERFQSFNQSLTDLRLENEFEVLLFSISSTLGSLTRVVACFLKGSTDCKSHSRLSLTLAKYPHLHETQRIVSNANTKWAESLKERRDTAVHYIALSIQSSITHKKNDSSQINKKIMRIGIPKAPVKFSSIWEDLIPVIGSTSHSSWVTVDSGKREEIHELRDRQNKLIVRTEAPLPKTPELIDGEKYIHDLYNDFNAYVIKLFITLEPWLLIKSP